MCSTRFRGMTGRSVVSAILISGVVLAAIVLVMRPKLDAPHEYARVRHPAGFSIVSPLNWQADYRPQRLVDERLTDAIKLTPERAFGTETTLMVTRIGQQGLADPFPGFVDATLQGEPARIFDGRRDGLYTFVAIFRRDGLWYSIALTTPDKPETTLSAGPWMKFFETFRVDEPPATRPS
jgi:hypothetical protein